MSPRNLLLALALLVPAAFAGCVERDSFGTLQATANAPAEEPGEMTARESEEYREGLDLPGGIGAMGPYYAERIVTVEGDLTLDRLPVALSTVNGNVDVASSEGTAWRVVFRLRGTGFTPVDAKENLDSIKLEWSHEDGDHHFLKGKIEHDGESGDMLRMDMQKQGFITLELPGAIVASLRASTVNGHVRLRDVVTDPLTATSVNGDVAVDAPARNVAASSVNGDVELSLQPVGTGTVKASSVNGAAALRVPETPRHGYEVRASSVNGAASITLQDGDAREKDGYGSSRATFRTHGFADREIRSVVSLQSVNGNVHAGPR